MSGSILSLQNVSFKYASGKKALSSINLKLPKRKKIALLGENGAGKSTLMLLLNGILQPTEGYLCYEQEKFSYKKKALRNLRVKVGFLFQDSDNQLIAPSVYEEISFGLNNLSTDKDWVRSKIDKAIDDFCLHDLIDKSPHTLSAGQKKRVCLASVLSMEPELVVCDEPASSLDPWHSELTFNYLNRLHQQGKTLLITTHDVNQAYTWADYIIILNKGEIKYTGTPKEVFSQKKIIEEAGLHLPFIVEASNTLLPELKPEDLPSNMEEFKNLLKVTLCMDS